MKNRTKLPNIYIGVVTAVLYLPIVLVIIYSFNESKISSVWGGFSLKWYETLFRDAAMFEALGNSIVLALCASLGAAVIGTLGAYGFTKVQLRTKSAVEYVSMLPIMIPDILKSAPDLEPLIEAKLEYLTEVIPYIEEHFYREKL